MAGRSTERLVPTIDFNFRTTYSSVWPDDRGRVEDRLDVMELAAYVNAINAEFLAVMEGSRIGNVSTGLSEEAVAKSLKQHKYTSMEEELCCICQEEYVEGDELGRLDCAHHFHSSCIKQWLTHKNLCPICKNIALNVIT